MLAIIFAFEEYQAKLEEIQTNNPFLVYLDYKALKYFITTITVLALAFHITWSRALARLA